MSFLQRWLLACCLSAASAAVEPGVGSSTSLLQVKAEVRGRARASRWLSGADKAANSEQDVVYHLHIPKVAGLSFGQDTLAALREHGMKVASREGCLAWEESNPRVLHSATLLRDPRSHVVSQFDFCRLKPIGQYGASFLAKGEAAMPSRFEDWVRSWAALKDGGWSGDFTPTEPPPKGLLSWPGLVSRVRISAWEQPPFSPEPTHLARRDWPSLDGGGTIWHMEDIPFHCYAPLSMQAQRLTCRTPLNYTTMPDGSLAVSKMKSMWFVGLVEAYQASACLLRVKLGEPLPSWCNCRRPEEWNRAPLTSENINHVGHHVSDFSQEVLDVVDKLTEADRVLYDAARERFVSEIHEAEQRFNTTILCNEKDLMR